MKVLVFSENDRFLQEVDHLLNKSIGIEVMTTKDIKSGLITFLSLGKNDVLLFDFTKHDQGSVKLLNALTSIGEGASVLAVIAQPDPEKAKFLLTHGVLGGIPLDGLSRYLMEAIKAVSGNGIYFVGYDTMSTECLDDEVAKLSNVDQTLQTLSEKQREVVDGLRHGYSNKQIAKVLNIELSTVKYHLTVIYKTLGITRRNQIFTRLDSQVNHAQPIL